MNNPIRKSIEVAGLLHKGLPIPVASRIGPFVATGGISGLDPQRHLLPTDLADQVRQMFLNLRAIVTAAGASCEAVLKLTIWVKATEARPLINEEWIKMFPNPQSRPARHILNYDLPGGMLVQCEALAIVLEAQ